MHEIDSAIDVLVRHARRGRGPHDLALILFAHGLPVNADLVRAAIASIQEAALRQFAELTEKALGLFPAPADIGFALDEDFERAEALAHLALSDQSSSVHWFRQNLQAQGEPTTSADLLQLLTYFFHMVASVDESELGDTEELPTRLMRALDMAGMLESAAQDVPPLLEHGPIEFIEAARAVAQFALRPLPADLGDDELSAARDFAVLLDQVLSAVASAGPLHYLGGELLATLWDPSDPGRVAITSSLLIHVNRTWDLDPSPLVDAVRDLGWIAGSEPRH
jgi:hypothetical protein